MNEKKFWLLLLIFLLCILIGYAYADPNIPSSLSPSQNSFQAPIPAFPMIKENQSQDISLRERADLSTLAYESSPYGSSSTGSSTSRVHFFQFRKVNSEPFGPIPSQSKPSLKTTESVSIPINFFGTNILPSPYTPLLTSYILSANRQLELEQAKLISNAILFFSERYGVDFRLIASVVSVESSFRHDAISSSGAIGLGQLKPETAHWLGVVNPFDPVDNLAGTTRYLSFLVNKYGGNLDKAVSAYFQGQGNIDREGLNDACRYYLDKVNLALNRFPTNF